MPDHAVVRLSDSSRRSFCHPPGAVDHRASCCSISSLRSQRRRSELNICGLTHRRAERTSAPKELASNPGLFGVCPKRTMTARFDGATNSSCPWYPSAEKLSLGRSGRDLRRFSHQCAPYAFFDPRVAVRACFTQSAGNSCSPFQLPLSR